MDQRNGSTIVALFYFKTNYLFNLVQLFLEYINF